MTRERTFVAVAAFLVLAVAAGVAYSKLRKSAEPTAVDDTSDQWTCSMHPQIRLDHPGRCPICGMALIPVSQAKAAQQKGAFRTALETEPIRRRELFKELRTVGKFDYSERRVAYISARVAGRVDRVYADFTGVEVKRGDHLLNIYSPDLYSAQRELLLALDGAQNRSDSASRGNRVPDSRLLDSVRRKLLLLGLLPEQIAEIESTRKTPTSVTIYAPIGGVVIEKSVREGQYVKDGDALYRIADLDPIWLYLNIYEDDVAWVRHGQKVDVSVQAFLGEVFEGVVTFIDPFLDDATRTVKVRVNLPNKDRRIKPQMYATAIIHVRLDATGAPEPTGLEGKYICPMHPEIVQDQPGNCPLCEMPLQLVPGEPPSEHAHEHAEHPEEAKGMLAIPVTAVLDTGRRRIAYRVADGGDYELVELQLGPRVEAVDEKGIRHGFFPVFSGLSVEERVVIQSGFLLDSQRQIEGMPSLLYPEGSTATSQLHAGHGGGPPAKTPSASPDAAHQH